MTDTCAVINHQFNVPVLNVEWYMWQSVTAALNVALLAQEEAEQERRHLRNQLAVTMRKMVSVCWFCRYIRLTI